MRSRPGFTVRIVNRRTGNALISGDGLATAEQVGRAVLDAYNALRGNGHDPHDLRPDVLFKEQDGSVRRVTEEETAVMVAAMRQHSKEAVVKPLTDLFDEAPGKPDTLH